MEYNSPAIDDLYEIYLMMKVMKNNYSTVTNAESEDKVGKTAPFTEILEIFDSLFQSKKNTNAKIIGKRCDRYALKASIMSKMGVDY